ncbi:putative folate metabolism gamma-glutamate ligase [soil metagenome]
MKITAYKTRLVTVKDTLNSVIAEAIPELPERSIVVIASKIVSTVENRFVPKTTDDKDEKHELVRKEADLFLEPHSSKYNLMLTIKRNWMFVNAGIDESNSDNQFILWPEDPQKSINDVWRFLREHYGVKEVGVTMSDSTSIPLNWGVVGHAIAYCGFNPLRSYIGKADLFGREMKMEQLSIMQSVTAAAVMEMGEGNEQTPLAVVSDLQNVEFATAVPTEFELATQKIEITDDAYAPILEKADWQKRIT